MKDVRKIFWAIGLVILLAGCNSDYDSYIEAGNDAIREQDYETAITNYSKAIAEKETDEAAIVYDALVLVQEGLEAYENDEDYDVSTNKFKEVMKLESESIEIMETIKSDVKEYLETSELALQLFEKITKQIDEGKASMENDQHDEARTLFEQAASTEVSIESKKITAAVEEAKDLLEQVNTAMGNDAENKETTEPNSNTSEEKQETSEEASEEAERNHQSETEEETSEASESNQSGTEEKASENKQSGQGGKQSVDKATENGKSANAEEQVRNFIKKEYAPDIFETANLELNYDHDNEKGHQIYQLFQVVNDESGVGHTATWGWYAYNPENGSVYDPFGY